MLKTLREYLPTLGTVIGLGTFLAILAPYNTAGMGWPNIWFYWTGLMAFGWLCAGSIMRLMERYLVGWPPIAFYGLMSFLVSIPMTVAVSAVQFWSNSSFPLSALPFVFVMVWVISAGVTFIGYLGARGEALADDTAQPGAGRALLDKLPPKLQRATLLALESEDHYLRVHTDAGDALILMRLGDAIAAVETLDGARTHRSWWVARQAVDRIARGDGRATLFLNNGLEAPVSRTYAPALRDAGWY